MNRKNQLNEINEEEEKKRYWNKLKGKTLKSN